MDITYFMKIQNAYGTKNRREKELIKINNEMSKHFEDTFDTEEVFLNGIPAQLMIIKDTDGNTFKKKIKSVNGNKFNLGDYVEWNSQMWLITLVDVDEKTWNRGYMYLCTVPLRWQNSEGEIIERWAYSEDFTKYSNGTMGNSTVTIGDNQYGLTLPIDSETKKLKRDMRFPIDFDDSEEPDIYKLTNRKVKLNDNHYFGRGGTMIVTMSFDVFNKNNDKRITIKDGSEVWICNYNDPSSPLPSASQPLDEKDNLNSQNIETKNSDYTIKILYEGKNYIFAGGEEKTFTALLFDSHGNQIKDHVVDWNITTATDKGKYISYEILDDNSITIESVYDSSIIGQKILLTASALGIQKSIYIDIGGGI